jgi:hypothetical protein
MLPEWLVAGLGVGVGVSVIITGLFLAADRLFPAAQTQNADVATGFERRRWEIRVYLRSIDEPFVERATIADCEVAFYLPDRDVAITFDPQVYYRLAPAAVERVLVEQELPGFKIGTRLPFETPAEGGSTADEQGADETASNSADQETDEPAGRDRSPPAHVQPAFRELGVPPTATFEDVKRAYRARVKEVHPDQNGDPESFKRVREAYVTASQYTAR